MLWVRYEDLLAEPLHEVRRVAEALRSPLAHDDAALRAVVEAASFAQMKERHERTEGSAALRNLGEAAHFREGAAGRWRDHLSPAQQETFQRHLCARLAGSGLEHAFPK